MSKADQQFNTPILFIIFNRPLLTQRVFEKIREIKPKELYIAADGPRNNEEKKKCEQAQKIVKKIDWDCDIHYKYEKKNLGCKMNVSSAIGWFFENVEQGIILEDDCLTNESFFHYCEELLEYYEDNEQIMMISGNNFQDGKQRGDGSYYFSKFNHIWGWATWRRAWNKYDLSMKNWPNFKQQNKLKEIWKNKEVEKYWIDIFNKVYNNEIDTWDFQWTYSIWENDGLSIIPNVNLVSNIGWGVDATHTKKESSNRANLGTFEIGTIIHPKRIERNITADTYTLKKFNIKKSYNLFKRLKKFLWEI